MHVMALILYKTLYLGTLETKERGSNWLTGSHSQPEDKGLFLSYKLSLKCEKLNAILFLNVTSRQILLPQGHKHYATNLWRNYQ